MTTDAGLHRNIHPNHYDHNSDQVTMEAFSATGGEDYKLSVDCERVWSGKLSFSHRTVTLGKASMGVWTIPRSQVANLKISILADAIEGNPAHSLIEFPTNDKSRRRDIARRLAALANTQALSRI
ncbi:MAG: hypothetical protein ACMUJJ_08210 [Roseicyclus sp.]|uniref:hypothetical protein n=1 Tax=Roseicyclus sp. TaxID=1914329 RepID=UPI003A84E565